MKKLIVLILICLSQFNSFAQQNEEIEFIKNFYEVYMFNFDKVEPNRGFNEISKTLVDNYLTKELNIRINKAIKNGVDYNIILNAQDEMQNLLIHLISV